MNLTRDRVRSIGWAFVLTVCLALTTALTLRVNAVRGQVVQKERQIVAMERDIQSLQIEFQARANQQQLTALNDVEFGYTAPTAAQYIEGERQLAALGKPRDPGAPALIRTAQAVTDTKAMPFVAMVSPVAPPAAGIHRDDASNDTAGTSAKHAAAGTHSAAKAQHAAAKGGDVIGGAIAEADLGTRVSRIELPKARNE